MTKWTSLVRPVATTLLVAFLIVGLVGCQQQAEKSKEAPKAGEKAKEPAKAEPAKPAAPAKPAPTAPAAKPAQPPPPPQPAPPPPAPKPSAQATPPPAQQKPTSTVQKATTETPAKPQATTPTAGTPAASDAEKKAQIEDLIYAEMRVKMESMITQRAQLLKSGKTSSDPEVQKLETSILRARKLLTDAGEVVGDINPPITTPPQM